MPNGGGALWVYRHLADRVDLELEWLLAYRNGLMDGNRPGDVLEVASTSLDQLETVALLDLLARCSSDHHLARMRSLRHARGEIDGRAEPVPVARHRSSRVHADANRRLAVGSKLLRYPKAQPHSVGGVRNPDHHLVADRLDFLRAVIGEESSDTIGELDSDLDRLGVAMSFRQCREASEVGENEGLRIVHAASHRRGSRK